MVGQEFEKLSQLFKIAQLRICVVTLFILSKLATL